MCPGRLFYAWVCSSLIQNLFCQPLCHSVAQVDGVWLLLAGNVIGFSPKDISVPLVPSLTWREANSEQVRLIQNKCKKIVKIKSEYLASFIKKRIKKNLIHVVTSKQDLQDADDLEFQVNSSGMCCFVSA
jgi:hypothetical protein